MKHRVGDIIKWVGRNVSGAYHYRIEEIKDGMCKLSSLEPNSNGGFSYVDDMGFHTYDGYINNKDLFEMVKPIIPKQSKGW